MLSGYDEMSPFIFHESNFLNQKKKKNSKFPWNVKWKCCSKLITKWLHIVNETEISRSAFYW